jgi:hypothetical protein
MVKNIKIDYKEHEYVNLKKKYIESLKVIKILIEKNRKNKILYSNLLNKYEIQSKEISLYIDKLNYNEDEINALEFLIEMYQDNIKFINQDK